MSKKIGFVSLKTVINSRHWKIKHFRKENIWKKTCRENVVQITVLEYSK